MKFFTEKSQRTGESREMKKHLLMIGAVGIMGILLVFLGYVLNPGETFHVPRVFGATYMTRNNSFFDELHKSIEEVVEENGDILIVRDPCQDQEKQNEQIAEMIEEEIEVLFLNPVDWEKVKPALLLCEQAGITVINVDTLVKDTEYVDFIVETDNYMAGVLCAQEMMRQTAKARIVIIKNEIQSSAVNRVQGFLDTISGNHNYEVVYMASGAGEFEVSAKVMADFLEEKIPFDVVFGENDPSALGALAALQQGRQEKGVMVYGIDGSPDFKAMLELGLVSGTSAQSPKTIGKVAAEKAYDYLNGLEIEPYISITPYMINKENLNHYEVNSWQ